MGIILVQRIVRSKGSKVAVLSGKVHEVKNLSTLRAMTQKRRQVFAYLTEDSAEGIMRSGRKMRPVDANVRNVKETMPKL
jgi:hypothetical protein